MRNKIVVANWKMNTDEYESKNLTYEILKYLDKTNNPSVYKILCVPFPFLNKIHNMCEGVNMLFVGAQNCSAFESGAYTGEVSSAMLKSLSISYAIVGHSERRIMFKEADDVILEKMKRLISKQIIPIYCCGEPFAERKKKNHIRYVLNQIEQSVCNFKKEEIKKVVIAYEPIWAIGTGITAELEDVQEMHFAIRKFIRSKYGSSVSKNLSLLYGGSVNPLNAKQIFDLPDVDGGLIGGASLKSQDFIDIVNSIT